MKIRTLVVGQLQTNCHLLINRNVKQAAIIDPGDDAGYISQIIAMEKVKPKFIIATHGHFDHISAALELQLGFNIPFLINKKDEFLVKRINETSLYFTGHESGPPPIISSFLKLNQQIKLGKDQLEIIETPGHTPGSICLYHKEENLLFGGDLIFSMGGVGRTDFSYSSSLDLKNSIEKIIKLPKQTKIFTGHGKNTAIEQELRFHLE